MLDTCQTAQVGSTTFWCLPQRLGLKLLSTGFVHDSSKLSHVSHGLPGTWRPNSLIILLYFIDPLGEPVVGQLLDVCQLLQVFSVLSKDTSLIALWGLRIKPLCWNATAHTELSCRPVTFPAW